MAKAIRRCLDQVTEHHSVTSRRHAISTILRSELDAELSRVITGYGANWERHLLEGFSLSYAWLRAPEGGQPISQDLSKVDQANECAARWRARLKRAIRSAQAMTSKPHGQTCQRFCCTLDSTMNLIDTFSALRPAHTHGPTGRVALKAQGHYDEYCELCWRPTEFFTHGDLRDAEDRKLGLSRRFCSEHNPQTSASNYRRDLKFKERFLAEVASIRKYGLARNNERVLFLQNTDKPSGWEMHLAPATAHPEDVRRAAYALVHSKLQGTPSQCWALKKQGMPTQEIANCLGVTDRAVRMALSSIKPKLSQAEQVRWGTLPRR